MKMLFKKRKVGIYLPLLYFDVSRGGFMKFLTKTMLFLAAVLISGLASAQTSSDADAGGSAAAPAAVGNYIIHPLDVIEFRVFQEPSMQQQIRVSQDGTVTLPLIRQVKIGGMTVDAAQALITELYDKDYLVNPQVTLVVLNYTERKVYVHGQVNRAGPVLIAPETELTLAQAISQAGGLTRLGRKDPIRIRRQGQDRTINVDFDDVLKDPRMKDIVLEDGDIIYVDERVF